MTLKEYDSLLACNWPGYQYFNKYNANQDLTMPIEFSSLIAHAAVYLKVYDKHEVIKLVCNKVSSAINEVLHEE